MEPTFGVVLRFIPAGAVVEEILLDQDGNQLPCRGLKRKFFCKPEDFGEAVWFNEPDMLYDPDASVKLSEGTLVAARVAWDIHPEYWGGKYPPAEIWTFLSNWQETLKRANEGPEYRVIWECRTKDNGDKVREKVLWQGKDLSDHALDMVYNPVDFTAMNVPQNPDPAIFKTKVYWRMSRDGRTWKEIQCPKVYSDQFDDEGHRLVYSAEEWNERFQAQYAGFTLRFISQKLTSVPILDELGEMDIEMELSIDQNREIDLEALRKALQGYLPETIIQGQQYRLSSNQFEIPEEDPMMSEFLWDVLEGIIDMYEDSLGESLHRVQMDDYDAETLPGPYGRR